MLLVLVPWLVVLARSDEPWRGNCTETICIFQPFGSVFPKDAQLVEVTWSRRLNAGRAPQGARGQRISENVDSMFSGTAAPELEVELSIPAATLRIRLWHNRALLPTSAEHVGSLPLLAAGCFSVRSPQLGAFWVGSAFPRPEGGRVPRGVQQAVATCS